MAQKKSKLAKVFIFLTLIFIVFASFAVYIVMYAWINANKNNPCQEWFVLNTETWECEEETENTNEENINNTVIDNEESCKEAGWTRYEENKICIWANETQNIEGNNIEINEEENNEIVEKNNE